MLGELMGKVHVIGGAEFISPPGSPGCPVGCGVVSVTRHEVFDPASQTWTTDAPALVGTAGAAAGTIDGRIYVAGGVVVNVTGGVSVDTLQIFTPLPTSGADCKNDGWKAFGVFKDQGECVSFVATGGKNPPH